MVTPHFFLFDLSLLFSGARYFMNFSKELDKLLGQSYNLLRLPNVR